MHTVFNARCELIIIYQNMKYRIVLTLYIVLVQGQVNRNFGHVRNVIGPGRTSRAWYFHSPGLPSAKKAKPNFIVKEHGHHGACGLLRISKLNTFSKKADQNSK